MMKALKPPDMCEDCGERNPSEFYENKSRRFCKKCTGRREKEKRGELKVASVVVLHELPGLLKVQDVMNRVEQDGVEFRGRLGAVEAARDRFDAVLAENREVIDELRREMRELRLSNELLRKDWAEDRKELAELRAEREANQKEIEVLHKKCFDQSGNIRKIHGFLQSVRNYTEEIREYVGRRLPE